MSAPRDRCGGESPRPAAADSDQEAVTAREVIGLSARGRAFLDALRDDERFRDIIANPFGDHGTPPESHEEPAGS